MNPGDLVHVAGPVWLLVGQKEGRFPFAHSIVVRDGETVLIDTGAGPEVLAPWASSGEVDLVLITHTHPDHIASSHMFKGAEVLAPKQAASSLESINALSERFFDDAGVAAIWRGFIQESMAFRAHRPTGTFAPDQEIKVGGTIIRAMHTPGHTVDHSCFYLPQWDLLISADIDLTPFGPWYANPECDMKLFRRSIYEVARLNPAVLISSHKGPFTSEITPALRKYSEVMDLRSRRILSRLRQEKTLAEIMDIKLIYGAFPFMPTLLRYWEGVMVQKHLNELIEQGLVQATERGYVAI